MSLYKNKNNITTSSWKTWLIKKLLTKNTGIDDILKIINENNEIINEEKNIKDDDNNEDQLISNIFSLSEKSVEDVMVPRAEIVSIEKKQNIQNILSLIKKESHSRMPVYENNLDNIIGFVHIKDVIRDFNTQKFNIDKILRDVLYVAPKSPILELLKRMRSSRIHIGLVVDEFGGVDGLVTIEDLVEEIVGEIEDEHDVEDNIFQKINETSVIVDASYKLIDLEKHYNINILEIKKEEIDTVGGLVFFIAGKIPLVNETYKYKNILDFKILNASDRRINKLLIKRI